jgi:hypothetical protein
MKDLQEKNDWMLGSRNQGTSHLDVMIKNTTRDIHEKHSKSIKSGTFWKEDVKKDSLSD